MQVNLNKLDEYFDVSYVSPFLTTFPLIILFEGEMVMAYGHILKGIEARGAAITLIVIGYLMIHSLLFKIPNQIGGKIKVKGTLRIFFKSKFFISWKLCIICIIILLFINHIVIYVIYIILLINCFIFQRKFNKELEKYLFNS